MVITSRGFPEERQEDKNKIKQKQYVNLTDETPTSDMC